jgi:hypothetical protein
MIHGALLGVLKDTCRTAGIGRYRMFMEYTCDECCDMFRCAEYSLRYPAQLNPDADIFRRLEQRLCEEGSEVYGTRECRSLLDFTYARQ